MELTFWEKGNGSSVQDTKQIDNVLWFLQKKIKWKFSHCWNTDAEVEF